MIIFERDSNTILPHSGRVTAYEYETVTDDSNAILPRSGTMNLAA